LAVLGPTHFRTPDPHVVSGMLRSVPDLGIMSASSTHGTGTLRGFRR